MSSIFVSLLGSTPPFNFFKISRWTWFFKGGRYLKEILILNSFSFREKDPRFTRLKPDLALSLLSKGLFYIRAMTSLYKETCLIVAKLPCCSQFQQPEKLFWITEKRIRQVFLISSLFIVFYRYSKAISYQSKSQWLMTDKFFHEKT